MKHRGYHESKVHLQKALPTATRKKVLLPLPDQKALTGLYRGMDDGEKRVGLIISNWQFLSDSIKEAVYYYIRLRLNYTDLTKLLDAQLPPSLESNQDLNKEDVDRAKKEDAVNEFFSIYTYELPRIPAVIPSGQRGVYDLTDLLMLASPVQNESKSAVKASSFYDDEEPPFDLTKRIEPNTQKEFKLEAIDHASDFLDQLAKKAKFDIPISFPGSAYFAKGTAQFQFKFKIEVQEIMARLKDKDGVSLEETTDGQIWLKFNEAACKEGKVKDLLELYTYENKQAAAAASYLAYRATKTEEYYDRFGFFSRWFGESRTNRCVNAFTKISGTIDFDNSKLPTNVFHYKNIANF